MVSPKANVAVVSHKPTADIQVRFYPSVRSSDSPSPLHLLPAAFPSGSPPQAAAFEFFFSFSFHPCCFFLSYLSPCAPLCLKRIFFFFKERGDWKGEEGLMWEGWLFISAASSRLHVATKTTERATQGNVRRAATATCTLGTPHPRQAHAVSTPSSNTGRRVS